MAHIILHSKRGRSATILTDKARAYFKSQFHMSLIQKDVYDGTEHWEVFGPIKQPTHLHTHLNS